VANNPRAFDPRAREARQAAYESTQTLAQRHPKVAEIGVSLQFTLPGGKPHSSPHRRLFMPDMQAFFDMQCPDRDCSNGGFDLETAIDAAVRSKSRESRGHIECKGKRNREACGIALDYSVEVVMREG
jgi:hypothetical protein